MNKPRFPRLAALADLLFEQPVSRNYLTIAFIIIIAGGVVVYSDNQLPEIFKHLVTVATMLGIARLFNSRPMRWAWAGIVGLMGLVLMLEVAVFLK